MTAKTAGPGSPDHPDRRIEVEPSPRRVRVGFAGETIADSTRVLLMREEGCVPVYYVPMADVRMALCEPADHRSRCPWKGEASYWTVAVGARRAENAMWSYREPLPQVAAIKDHVAFYWDRMDTWREEDEEVFVHPRDPKKRVDVLLSHRPVEVVLGGVAVAASTEARFLFETGMPTRYYLPPADVRLDLLRRSATRTRCPYKGIAHYRHAAIGAATFPDIAWSYPDPIAECPAIKGLIAFFNENVDAILVDGVATERPLTRWRRAPG